MAKKANGEKKAKILPFLNRKKAAPAETTAAAPLPPLEINAEIDEAEDLFAQPEEAPVSSGLGQISEAASAGAAEQSSAASAADLPPLQINGADSAAYAMGAGTSGSPYAAGSEEDAEADLFSQEEKSGAETAETNSGSAGAGEAASGVTGEKKKRRKTKADKAEEAKARRQARLERRAQALGMESSIVPDVTVDESAHDRSDSRSLTEVFGRNRAVWLIVGVVALLIVLIIIMFSDRLYNQVEGRASYTLTKTSTQVEFAEGNVNIGMYGSQLLRCSQDGIQAVTERGTVVWDIPFTMSAPKMNIAGDYISVADQLGMTLMVINNGVVSTEVSTESNILMSALNAQGQSAVVLAAKDGHIVNLYGPDGSLLMQRRTFQISDGIPIAVALSENGTRMATVYVNYTGTVLKSIITVFDLTESGSLLVDRVVGSVSYDEIVISDLKFVGNRLFFAGSELIGAVTTREGVEKEWETKLSYRLEALVMEEDDVASLYGEGLAGTAERIDQNIVVYNYSGNIISSLYDQDASYLGACDDTIIVGMGRSYMGLSSSGAVKWTMDSTEDYMELIAFPSGRSVAALKRSEIEFYDVTLKGAALEDD